MKTWIAFIAVAIWLVPVSNAASDFQLAVDSNGTFSWFLASISSPQIHYGAIPSGDNPTINLVVGKRYEITNVPQAAHPFQIVAKGVTDAGDVVLLSYGAEAGSFEGDPAVNWTEIGAVITFTVTPGLVSAMSTTGHSPGYRCGIHTDSMRGDLAIFGNGAVITNPIPAAIARGTIAVLPQPIAENFTAPLGAAFPKDGSGRMFIYDQNGVVKVMTSGVVLETPLLDVSARMVPLAPGYDERGLTGFALHPKFASNHKVYTKTSEPVSGAADFTVPMTGAFDHQEVIAEWTISAGNSNRIDPASRRELMRIDHPQSNHNGGAIRFGNDGYLYIGMGDGGNANDVGAGHVAGGNAQDTNVILGKILRIDVDTTNSANHRYGIPAGNPFVGGGGLKEIYATGVRNPYSFSFDSNSGALYVGDVGQNNVEEIDGLTSGSAGRNLGWNLKEGTFNFDPATGNVVTVPVAPPPPGLMNPIAQYDHDEGIATIGGFVYRGTAIPALGGKYVFGDLAHTFSDFGRLFYLDTGNQIKEFVLGTPSGAFGMYVKGFAQDLSGEVYVCGSMRIGPSGTTGTVFKLIPYKNAVRHWDGY